jgi:hypothetical protein
LTVEEMFILTRASIATELCAKTSAFVAVGPTIHHTCPAITILTALPASTKEPYLKRTLSWMRVRMRYRCW